MFWYFLRNTLYHCFHIWFKRVKIEGAEKVRGKGPMFIAMNHPNAFMDPISFAAMLFYPRTYYMARGDAFKKGAAAFLLQSMGIVPIYRLRDGGYENVKKNLESFKIAYKLLDRKERIMVFAEGLSIMERRLRSIQKGTAKMSFGYLDQGGSKDLRIVPVGISYSEPHKFRTYVYFQIGEPIVVADYYEEYKTQPAHAILKLTREIEERMKPLVPSLADPENDVLAEQLQSIVKREYLAENNLTYDDSANQHKYWEFIIERLNSLTKKNPDAMEAFRKEVDEYSQELNKLKLRDHLLYREQTGKKILSIMQLILLVLGFPVYLIGKILNFPAYYFALRVGNKVKSIEFKAAFMFGVGAILINLTLLIELIILWVIWHSWTILLSYTIVKALTGGLGLLYSPFRKRTVGALLFQKLKKANPSKVKSLLLQRRKILDFLGSLQ